MNYLERRVLQRGFTLEQIEHDYGYDVILLAYNDRGEIEPGNVLIQVKATDHLRLDKRRKTISYPLDRADLQLWLREPDPVVLVVYDGEKDKAYWLYVQAYFEPTRPIGLFTDRGTVTVHIPVANRLTLRAVGRFAKFRDAVASQM